MSARAFKFKAKPADKKRFMKSLNKFLNDNDWEIKLGWLENCHGYCDYTTDTIYINLCYVVAGILIHEFLHAKYPFLSENNVGKLEIKILNTLSSRQIKKLAMKIMIGRTITSKDFRKIPEPNTDD